MPSSRVPWQMHQNDIICPICICSNSNQSDLCIRFRYFGYLLTWTRLWITFHRFKCFKQRRPLHILFAWGWAHHESPNQLPFLSCQKCEEEHSIARLAAGDAVRDSHIFSLQSRSMPRTSAKSSSFWLNGKQVFHTITVVRFMRRTQSCAPHCCNDKRWINGVGFLRVRDVCTLYFCIYGMWSMLSAYSQNEIENEKRERRRCSQMCRWQWHT